MLKIRILEEISLSDLNVRGKMTTITLTNNSGVYAQNVEYVSGSNSKHVKKFAHPLITKNYSAETNTINISIHYCCILIIV